MVHLLALASKKATCKIMRYASATVLLRGFDSKPKLKHVPKNGSRKITYEVNSSENFKQALCQITSELS